MFSTNIIPKYAQFLISVGCVLLVSVSSFFLTDVMGHKVVALVLLLVVSLLAMVFEILPVLLAAILSALIWNYFFIPPIYTFHIDNAEDLLMFSMYFVVVLLNAVFTTKIRKQEKIVSEKEKKENAIKLYNTLLNSLSHELRTPISTIVGATDAIKENPQLTDLQKEKLLNEIENAGLRLNSQVDNLLNMSRLESGILHLKKEWVNVNEMVFSIIRKINEFNTTHKIIFIPNDSLPFFKMDELLIEQAAYNIIHNAVTYTPEGSKIVITLSYESAKCTIQISDNGQGFPDEEIPLVFDKFYRLADSKAGGTGLGLSISKGFVEAHDGDIELKNITNGGAQFTIRIPAETSYINHLKNE